jgi:hypothetical protein
MVHLKDGVYDNYNYVLNLKFKESCSTIDFYKKLKSIKELFRLIILKKEVLKNERYDKLRSITYDKYKDLCNQAKNVISKMDISIKYRTRRNIEKYKQYCEAIKNYSDLLNMEEEIYNISYMT